MKTRKYKGDIAWFAPKRDKPIFYTTTACADLVNELYSLYKSYTEVLKHITYGVEEKEACKKMIEAGWK